MFRKIFLTIIFTILGLFSFTNVGTSNGGSTAIDQVLGPGSESADYQINEITVDESFVSKIARYLLSISVMIGVAVFLYGGIRFFLSMGDDGKAKKARDLLIVSGIGLIIAFGSWAILQIILSTGTSIVSGQ